MAYKTATSGRENLPKTMLCLVLLRVGYPAWRESCVESGLNEFGISDFWPRHVKQQGPVCTYPEPLAAGCGEKLVYMRQFKKAKSYV